MLYYLLKMLMVSSFITSEVTYMQSINEKLGVMDTTAITLCMENKIPILVFALNEENSIKRAASGENIGTIIKE